MLAILKETWKEVAFLISLAGGFWYLLEPPIHGSSGIFSGFVGTVALSGALCVRAMLRQWTGRHTTITMLALGVLSLSTAVPLFTSYVVERSQLVVKFQTSESQTVEVIRGTEVQPWVAEPELKTDQELLSDAGGANARRLIWTPDSIIEAERRLAMGYVLAALATLLAAIFIVEILRLRTVAGDPTQE